MNFSEKDKTVNFKDTEYYDMVHDEKVTGSVTLKKYEVRILKK